MKGLLRQIWCRRPPILIPWRVHTGCWMLLGSDLEGLAYLRRYESKVVQFIRQYVAPGMRCVDVGAGQGYYTLLLAKLTRSVNRVIAFEPVPRQCVRLVWNARLNGHRIVDCAPGARYILGNIILVQKAVGGRPRLGQLHLAQGQEARSSLAPVASEVRAKTKLVPVAITSLDYYLDQSARVDFLKIDAEGAELEILMGAQRTIQRSRPAIAIEVADVTTRQFGYAAERLLILLKEWDYEIVLSAGDGAKVNGQYSDTFVLLPRGHENSSC